MDHTARPTLVTGATGYIGHLLVPELLQRGHRVRVLARDATRLARFDWADRVDVVTGSATDPEAVRRALDGVGVAYYLLHSMDGRGDFVERDRELATGFAAAARDAGADRIVYLSGLHPPELLSPHLASRVEVGRILLESGVRTAVLQAGVVIGDGSASFDMLRHLTERLPAMIGPRWLQNRVQPIAVDDVLHYLVAAADLPADLNRTFDVGGPDVLTYAEMIRRYARIAGLGRRLVAPIPVLTPSLASHWVGLVTPVASGVAKPLVGSLAHEPVATEDDLVGLVGEPGGGRTGFDEAVRRAVRTVDPHRWRRTALQVSAATAACAVIGSILTNPGSAWYRGLRKPAFQPPAAAFPVVWTTLYAGTAVAATATIAELAEDGHQHEAESFRMAHLANLGLNAAWSGLFFRGHRLVASTIVAGALAASSADLARRAAQAGPGKAAMFGAYAAWCAFATVLSAAVARRNHR